MPDRLQVRYSTNGASTNVGTLATDVGDFTNLALDINPTLAVGGYPETWTQFTLTAADITAAGTGRIAFRYFVTDGGPSGNNSNYIGTGYRRAGRLLRPKRPSLPSSWPRSPACSARQPTRSSRRETISGRSFRRRDSLPSLSWGWGAASSSGGRPTTATGGCAGRRTSPDRS